eukprot:8284926-Pyramimonas_sp.AAC.1
MGPNTLICRICKHEVLTLAELQQRVGGHLARRRAQRRSSTQYPRYLPPRGAGRDAADRGKARGRRTMPRGNSP